MDGRRPLAAEDVPQDAAVWARGSNCFLAAEGCKAVHVAILLAHPMAPFSASLMPSLEGVIAGWNHWAKEFWTTSPDVSDDISSNTRTELQRRSIDWHAALKKGIEVETVFHFSAYYGCVCTLRRHVLLRCTQARNNPMQTRGTLLRVRGL